MRVGKGDRACGARMEMETGEAACGAGVGGGCSGWSMHAKQEWEVKEGMDHTERGWEVTSGRDLIYKWPTCPGSYRRNQNHVSP